MSSYGQLKRDAEVHLPVGTVLPWTTATAPSGYFLCDGSTKSRTDYAALFAVIGTTYGAGDGSSTFTLPNLQSKQIIFDDISGNTYTLGGNAGTNSNTVAPNITKSGTINASVSGTTGNIPTNNGLVASMLPRHHHKIATATGAANTASGSPAITANSQVAQSGSTSDSNFRYGLISSNLTATLGKTSNYGGNNDNVGAGHTHSVGNLASSVNYDSFTLNVSSTTVNTLFSSVVLNAIIKF